MKIGPITIILIGAAFAVVALAYGYFHNYAPVTTAIGYKEAELGQLRNENAKAPQVEQRLQNAITAVRMKGEQWRQVVATNTPPTQVTQGGIDLAVTGYQLAVDTKRFRDSIQKAVNVQLKKGGVRVVTGLGVPDTGDDPREVLSSFYNYPAVPFPVVILDLGSTTVEGTYAQIMTNVKSWAKMPNYLAVADGLTITGTSPRLTGTYNVTVVAYIRGRQIGPQPVDGQGMATGGPPTTNNAGIQPRP